MQKTTNNSVYEFLFHGLWAFVFIFLSSNYAQSLTMGNTEECDCGRVTSICRFTLRNSIQDLLAEGDRQFGCAFTSEGFVLKEFYEASLKTYERAKEIMMTDFLDLRNSEDELLAAQAYYKLGILCASSISSLHATSEIPPYAIRYGYFASVYLFDACLLNQENTQGAKLILLRLSKSFERLSHLYSADSNLNIIAQFIAVKMARFDELIIECIAGTDSSHTGLKSRLNNFDQKLLIDLLEMSLLCK